MYAKLTNVYAKVVKSGGCLAIAISRSAREFGYRALSGSNILHFLSSVFCSSPCFGLVLFFSSAFHIIHAVSALVVMWHAKQNGLSVLWLQAGALALRLSEISSPLCTAILVDSASACPANGSAEAFFTSFDVEAMAGEKQLNGPQEFYNLTTLNCNI